MKRFIGLLSILLLVGTSTYAAIRGTRVKVENQILTRAVPTAATEGMDLDRVDGFRVKVCATAGNTLAGAGTLQAYVWSTEDGLWARNPTLDQTISVTATSCQGAACRCESFPDFITAVNYGRVLYATNGVTVSGGTTVDVTINGSLE